MQLLFAIVQDEDADLLGRRLTKDGFELTRLSTVGGFLASGNVTFLMGIEDARVSGVMEIIRQTCHTRRRYINPTPAGAEPAHLTLAAPAFPLEVLVGGATVFSFPVLRYVRAPGPEPTGTPATGPGHQEGGSMRLVLSIVQNEDAEGVTRALLAAGYRVTRMNTAGGFLRRGNVTLLAGVEEDKVDHVVETIRANTHPRGEASPTPQGMPAYSATIFVLEASQFLRI